MTRRHDRIPPHAAGFTLVELLVALSIFSLLMLTVAYTLRISGSLLQKTEQRYARDARLLSLLRDSLAGSYAYVGERGGLTSRNKEYFHYFYGHPREIGYISSRPSHGTGLTLTRLRYQDRNLLLDEAALYGLDRDYKAPVMPTGEVRSTLLLTDLTSFSIEYLSNGQWSSAIEETLPEAVKILYKKPDLPEIRELYVRIKDNFFDKKEFTEVISATPGGSR